jgi:hypothetical protein
MPDLPAPSFMPTLATLQEALERAERELICADMIDNHQRRQTEMAEARRHRDAVKAQIARIEEAF